MTIDLGKFMPMAFVVGLVAASVPAAQASVYAGAYNTGTNEFVVESAESGTVSATSSGPGGAAEARTGFGFNKAGAAANSISQEGAPQNTGGAYAYSLWSDDLAVGSSAASGYLNIALDLSYALSTALDGGYANVGVSYEFSAFGSTTEYYNLTDGTGGYGTGMSDGTVETIEALGSYSRRMVTLSIPFMVGQAISVSSNLACSGAATANGPGGSSASASCDATHSSYWAGVLGVTDDLGNAITDFTLTSASGTDYRQSFVPIASAVPELDTWAIMIGGLSLVGVVKRRRRDAQLAAA